MNERYANNLKRVTNAEAVRAAYEAEDYEAKMEKLRVALRLCVAWMERGAQARMNDFGERDRAERIRLAKEALKAGGEPRKVCAPDDCFIDPRGAIRPILKYGEDGPNGARQYWIGPAREAR